MESHRIVSRSEWLAARTALIAKEKALFTQQDELTAEQRALPWVKVEKDYVFDALSGKVTLADLFNGRSQLLIKHFMMGPGATHQCVGCSLEVDHVEGSMKSSLVKAMFLMSRWRARRSRKSRRFAGGWVGTFPGSRLTAATSTTISMFLLRPRSSPPATLITTFSI